MCLSIEFKVQPSVATKRCHAGFIGFLQVKVVPYPFSGRWGVRVLETSLYSGPAVGESGALPSPTLPGLGEVLQRHVGIIPGRPSGL